MLDEALRSSLDLPEPEDKRIPPAPPPLAKPPRAHYPDMTIPGLRPRLISQLSGSTIPTASLTCENVEDTRPHQRQRYVSSPTAGESSSSWLHRQSWDWGGVAHQLESGEVYPELDPATGLPVTPPRESFDIDGDDVPSRLHVQRTISELSGRGGEDAGVSLPFIGQLPAIPSMPGMPTLDFAGLPPMLRRSLDGGQRRSFSTSSKRGVSWTPNWLAPSKKRIDSMLSKEDRAPTKEEEQVKHQIKYATPQHPIVLCHGLLGFDYLGPASMPPLQISHWRGIREVLERNGCEVLIARVPATGSIKDRAEVLNETIAEKFPGRTINLIAHSMGGLDCRYLISQVKPEKFSVASLTTVSTPHRGSPFADYVIDNVIGRERLPQLLSVMESMNLPNSGDGSAFSALGTRAMREFNMEVIDSEDVKYFSWGASFNPGLMDTFRWPHSVIYTKEGPNDGLVSVYSAKWGEYRGTLLDVNHLDL